MSTIKFRQRTKDEINYVFITQRHNSIAPFVPPVTFNNNIIRFIKTSVLNLRQLVDPLQLYKENISLQNCNGVWLDIVYEDSINKYLAKTIDRASVQLFFVDFKIKKANKLVKRICSLGTNKRYLYLFNGNNGGRPYHEKAVKDSSEFLSKLMHDFKMEPCIIDERVDQLNISTSGIGNNNFYIYSNIIGKFRINSLQGISDVDENALYVRSVMEFADESKPFRRQEVMIDAIHELDKLYEAEILSMPGFAQNNIKFLSPIIIIAPFYNPEFRRHFKKFGLDALYTEQSANYNFPGIMTLHNAQEYSQWLTLVTKTRFNYLDDVSYLHASFTYSPVMRLPIRGVSIYKELSFFGVRGNLESHAKIKETISSFSAAYKQHLLGSQAEQLLLERNGQIVAISDLPIEWMEVDGVPLVFTHDVCRLPETSLTSLMASFATHAFTKYSVPKEVLKKTLVIFGASEDAFLHAQIEVENLSVPCGFFTRRCNTLDEVEAAVKELKPELLIFDCHGGYDQESNATYLWIGEEWLTNQEVIKRQIQAPLVFLSACGTAPTFGTIKIIAAAFMEAGALAVTSTYLPVSVYSGSYLYARVLSELTNNVTCFQNWLSFMCHVIRTASIVECFDQVYSEEELRSQHVSDAKELFLEEIKHFENRRRLFNEMDSIIRDAADLKPTSKLFSNKIPEYLYYSTIGRADLIPFEK